MPKRQPTRARKQRGKRDTHTPVLSLLSYESNTPHDFICNRKSIINRRPLTTKLTYRTGAACSWQMYWHMIDTFTRGAAVFFFFFLRPSTPLFFSLLLILVGWPNHVWIVNYELLILLHVNVLPKQTHAQIRCSIKLCHIKYLLQGRGPAVDRDADPARVADTYAEYKQHFE